MKTTIFAFVFLIGFPLMSISQGKKACRKNPTDTVITNISGAGLSIQLEFQRGPKHNHPILAIWMEDMNENYIQTLYVSQSMAKGMYEHGQEKEGKWAPGERRRPAALPYWAHKRGVRASDGLFVPDRHTTVPDAYTGPTPQKSFLLKTKTDKAVTGKFRLLFEINQPFDWNDDWYNSKFPDDKQYKTNGQPSMIYSVTIDPADTETEYFMNPIGHGHPSGSNGKMFTDLSTLTTARQITGCIKVKLNSTHK